MTRRNERASQILESRAGCGVTSITGLVEHLRGRARRLDHDGDAGGLPRQAAGPVSVSSFCGGESLVGNHGVVSSSGLASINFGVLPSSSASSFSQRGSPEWPN